MAKKSSKPAKSNELDGKEFFTAIELIEKEAAEAGLDAQFAWKSTARPFVTTPGKMTLALSEAIFERTGIHPELNTAGGTSDARFISTIADETVEFGPLNATIHSINECVGLDELEGLVAIYGRTVEQLLN